MKSNVKSKKYKLSLIQREGFSGALFLIPWAVGFIYFFAVPMISSLIYSFNIISFGNDGLIYEYAGMENYIEILTKSKLFWQSFTKVFNTLLYKVPIIVLFSLFLSLLLNRNFKGRLFFRTVFFIPLVIVSGTIATVISSSGMGPNMANSGNAVTTFNFSADGIFTEMLSALGLSSDMLAKFSSLINNIFEICWKSSIQIMLYLIGLQSIPSSYYEVCKIEGATSWECFWKITFPMISPITLLCLVFTVVATFTDSNSPMIININNQMQTAMHISSAMSWCYFLFVFVYTMLIIGIVSKYVKYMD